MEACRGELTIQPDELQSSSIAVAEDNGKLVGISQVKVTGTEADLLKLFVEPMMLRGGVEKSLFLWASNEAIAKGALRLVIEADPDAAPKGDRSSNEIGFNIGYILRTHHIKIATTVTVASSWLALFSP
jgi:hypothetical protein